MSKPKGPELVFFPESRIELGKELRKHPDILLTIENAEIPSDDYGALLGAIAGHFNVLMDGMYTPEDLDKLADKLVFKLRSKRANIITAPVGRPEL